MQNYKYETVDWDGLTGDVVERIDAIRQCWRESEARAPKAAHERLVEDVYMPAIKLLGVFCTKVDLGEKI